MWIGKRRALKATGVNSNLSLLKLWNLSKMYWHRQLGTALSWFVWDFAFYGNKLFQSVFIGIIVPHASLKTSLEWTLLNSTVALVGYYCAAFTVDKQWMGRRRMQVRQCIVCVSCFVNLHMLCLSATTLLRSLLTSSEWGKEGCR